MWILQQDKKRKKRRVKTGGKAAVSSCRLHTGRVQRLVYTAMLFAAAVVLSIVEGFLPDLPAPGVKFGLSNLAVMYALFFMGGSTAVTVAVLKSLFIMLTRSPVTGLLSLAGGLFSVLVMTLLFRVWKDKLSCFALSVCGAVSHNLGQLAAVCILYRGISFWFYLPPLLIFGAAAGMATAVLLRLLLPALKRIGIQAAEL